MFDDSSTFYDQLEEMHSPHTHQIEYRIFNKHQPHVLPIVWGKENAKTNQIGIGFGIKIQMSLVGGFPILDHLTWEPFNEGGYLIESVEKYKSQFGSNPAEVLADQIY